MSNEHIKITTSIIPIKKISLKTRINAGPIDGEITSDIEELKMHKITFRLLKEEE